MINWSLKHYLEKVLNSKTTIKAIAFLLLSSPLLLVSQDATATAATPEAAANSFNFLRWFLVIIIVSEVAILAIFSALIFKQFNLFQVTEMSDASLEGKESWIVTWWNKMNNFGKIEDEDKIDLGHNYDGIRELDNNIPAWFTAIFIGTMVFGVIYMWRYQVAKISPLQDEEYRLEVEQAELDYEKYLKLSGTSIDENTLAFADDKDQIANGKKLFQANCAACHVADGGGAAGPNLTDNSWINGCSAKDVYQSIKYGRKNGMMAWKDNFNDKQIIDIMNYVNSLKGTKPAAPKAAQGVECTPAVEAPTTAVADSTVAAK